MQKTYNGNPAGEARTRWLILKYFIIIYVPLFVALAVLAYASHRWEASKIIEKIKTNESKQADLGRHMLDLNLRHGISDLLYLSSLTTEKLPSIIADPSNTQELADLYFTFCRTRSRHLTIRLVSASGQDMILANRLAVFHASLPKPLQRNWTECLHFKHLQNLPQGRFELYAPEGEDTCSSVDTGSGLPAIRYGTPIRDENGEFAMALILDYDGLMLLDAVSQAGIASSGEIMLVGADGDWLLSRGPNKQWSYMFKDHDLSPAQAAFPQDWDIISQSGAGQIMGTAGLITHQSVILDSDKPMAIALQDAGPHNGADDEEALRNAWKLISFIPEWDISRRMSDLTRNIATGFAVLALLLAPGCLVMARSRIQTMRDRDKFMRLNTSLNEALRVMGKRNRENSLINRLSDFLQACNTEEEVFDVAARYAGRLLPGSAGAIYDLREQDTLLVEVANWGEQRSSMESFNQELCWAMRRGRPRFVDRPDYSHNCSHFQGAVPQHGYLCVPFIAQGKVLGLVTFEFEPGALDHSRENRDETRETLEQLAMTLADHVALSLANLRLRESLRDQSIRDALTGLYNRRHMQESLQREFARAQRHESPVSLIMFDVDHFKNFNDEHGHEAGDLVLKELAAMLQRSTRGEDIACRYGGEEFLIIMPGATTDLAEKRAEELRSTVERALTIRHSGKRLGVTVSLGVATYPDHAGDVDQALLKVDEAMYAAKQAGRNTVKVSS